ncbi:MAG TPA: ABC transporter ATP-binding protein [Clostridia bacterium]|nr:ABC transporter ATP-binding protein [Clostridia bacterium]
MERAIDRNGTACIEVENLKKYYPFKGGKTIRALDGVSLTVESGAIFGVVGESGCGKSTLGKCVMRLTDITEGRVAYRGADISRQPRKQILPCLRQMQMVFQNPYSSFNPKLKLGYSLREACALNGMRPEETRESIERFLGYISLSEDELNRFPHELSGGQLQRLAIARALLLKPGFIVADEPVSALDVSVQAQILNLILDLKQTFRMTMLFISHDMTVVEHICDSVAVMYLGAVVETGKTAALFSNLLHPYTQALMSAIPVVTPFEEKQDRVILTGDIPTAIDIPRGCRFASRCRRCMDVCKEVSPALREVEKEHSVACHLYAT